MTNTIENKWSGLPAVFRETILARHTMDTARMEDYNPNYIGGDINGGIIDIRQLFTRPALRWSPYKNVCERIIHLLIINPTRRRCAWDVWLLRS